MTTTTRTAGTPAADVIRQTRVEAGLTYAQAGRLCHRTIRAWQNAELGARKLDTAAWELFLLRIDRHPTHQMLRKGVAGDGIEPP